MFFIELKNDEPGCFRYRMKQHYILRYFILIDRVLSGPDVSHFHCDLFITLLKQSYLFYFFQNYIRAQIEVPLYMHCDPQSPCVLILHVEAQILGFFT